MRPLIGVEAVCAALALCAFGCAAQFPAKENKMGTPIWSITGEQLSRAQAKITYLGEQTKPVPTVAFGVEGHKVAMDRFLSVQRSRKPYPNDEAPSVRTFSVSREEFQRVLSALRPVLDRGAGQGPEFLSFTVLAGVGAAIAGQEFLIPQPAAREFYTRLLEALSPENREGQEIVQTQFRNVLPE